MKVKMLLRPVKFLKHCFKQTVFKLFRSLPVWNRMHATSKSGEFEEQSLSFQNKIISHNSPFTKTQLHDLRTKFTTHNKQRKNQLSACVRVSRLTSQQCLGPCRTLRSRVLNLSLRSCLTIASCDSWDMNQGVEQQLINEIQKEIEGMENEQTN